MLHELVPPLLRPSRRCSPTMAAMAWPAHWPRLDGLGYEAVPARHDDEWQVEAFNCVFQVLARQHPQVCEFDLAYTEATTGRRIHHMEYIVRGGHVCRFRIDPDAPPRKGLRSQD